MFFGKLADEGDNSNIYNVEGDNLVDNSNIYNVEGNNRLLPGLQLMITRSVLKIPFFPFFFSICVFYTGNYLVVFCKIKHSNFRHLRVVSVNKTVIAFIIGKHQVVNPREIVFPQAKALGLTAFDIFLKVQENYQNI
jgi:hypothetical protein